MAARHVKYAPREVAVPEEKDPLRWCKVGRHVPLQYRSGLSICQICKVEIAWPKLYASAAI